MIWDRITLCKGVLSKCANGSDTVSNLRVKLRHRTGKFWKYYIPSGVQKQLNFGLQ